MNMKEFAISLGMDEAQVWKDKTVHLFRIVNDFVKDHISFTWDDVAALAGKHACPVQPSTDSLAVF